MSWIIGDFRNFFLELKSKFGLYHAVLTTPKAPPEKLTLTVVELQHLSDIEKSDSKGEVPCIIWTILNGRKVCVHFQTDTVQLDFVVYRHRNNLHLKDNEINLKLTEFWSLLAKRTYLLSYFDLFHKRCIVLDETTVHR